MKITRWVLIILGVTLVCLYVYENYGMIKSHHVTGVQIDDKKHEGENYYIVVDDKKMKVKDMNTWMLLDTAKNYDLTYEWYGSRTPTVKEINQTGDHDSVGGGH
ncbi:hypothetical protein [Thalassobacillus hwangdonensis]|uniref:DUF3139 domain-containing protein n=1 Tax=Thalassobacillus hwangdonensis TaxID=546108 RepID=A0ABW3L1X7_9BACI